MGLRSIITVPIFLVAFCVVFEVVIKYQFRKEFPVTQTGVLLITGTSNGFGRHAAFALAKEGYHVFGTVRNNHSANDLSKEAKSLNLESHIHPILLDVSNNSQIDQAHLTISQYLNKSQLPFAGVINNAGVSFLSPFETMKEDKIRELMVTNCIGTILLLQKFIPLIRQHKSRILYITGFNGMSSRYAQSIYSASKYCAEAALDSIRLEMIRFGVSVSSILPACITTSPKKVKNPTDKVEIPGELIPLYGEKMKKILKLTHQGTERCTSPSVISDAILLALRDPFPNTRYYVGDTGVFIPFWLWRFLRVVLTDRMYDLVREWEIDYS